MKNQNGITLTILIVTIIIMMILAGVTLYLMTTDGILKNTESAAQNYESSEEEDVLSVAFSTVFSKSMLKDTEITPVDLQKELDKTGRKTEVRQVDEHPNILYVKFDKTGNEHSVNIDTGAINYEGKYSQGTEDILKQQPKISIVPNPTKWVNQDVSVEIKRDEALDTSKFDLEYKIGNGEWTKYTQAFTIPENCTITARYHYINQVSEYSSLSIQNIDKTLPAQATFNKDGGNVYTMPTQGNAQVDTTVTLEDKGGSGLYTEGLQYVWTQDASENAPTEGWKPFTANPIETAVDATNPSSQVVNKATANINKTDISEAGTWYLWVKYSDNAMKNGTKDVCTTRSQAFEIGEKTLAANQISMTPTPTHWTNGNVTVKVQFGANLTQEQRIFCTEGTQGTDYEISGNTVTVKKNGVRVSATGKDIAGNMVSAVSLTVGNIDKIAPQANFNKNGGNVYTMPTSGNGQLEATISITDEGGSGVYTSGVEYVWSKDTTAPATGWTKLGANSKKVIKTGITEAGTWYLYAKYNDVARNNTGTEPLITRSEGFTLKATTDSSLANKITLTPNKQNWTEGDIRVTATYGADLTQESRELSCTGTNGTDFTINGTDYVDVKGKKQIVTATATDIAGNRITVSLTVVKTYTVALNNQNATSAGTTAVYEKYSTGIYQEIGCKNPLTTITKPARTGYTFGGYYTATGGGGTQMIDGNGNITGSFTNTYYVNNGTLYAKWTTVSYTISYTLAGGALPNNLSNPTSYTVEANEITLVNPTRLGYTFTGWTGSNGTTPQKTVKIPKGSTENRNYTANWSEDEYTISYTLNGGSASNPGGYKITTDTITLNNPTRVGYTFTGWTGSNGTTPQKSVTIPKGSTGNKSYTANWSANVYTIALNHQNGSSSVSAVYEKYETGIYKESGCTTQMTTSANAIVVPTRTGYTFGGYYTATGGGGTQMIDSTGKVTSNFTNTYFRGNGTLYAKWTTVSYTISYTLAGGSLTSRVESYTIETNEITLGTPTRTGYTFTGWTGTGLSAATKTVKIPKGSTGNRSYTANWSENTYTIAYTLNGGSANNPETYKVTSNTITLTDPTRAGYTFTGWTGSNGTTPQKGVTIPKGSTGNKSYTANWTTVSYAISYTLGDGATLPAGKSNPTSYNIETNEITLINPTRTGYTFTGWTGTGLSAATMTVKIPKGSMGNRSYTANWSEDTYTITYTLNGGSASNPGGYKVTDTITLVAPTRVGYTFTGWTGSNGTTPQKSVTIPKGSTGNKSYTANWSVNVYTVALNHQSGSSSVTAVYEKYGTGIYKESGCTTQMTTSANAIAVPTRTGYTFGGYYTATGGGGTQMIDSAGKVTSNFTNTYFRGNGTLYAYWEQDTRPPTYSRVTITKAERDGTYGPWTRSALMTIYNTQGVAAPMDKCIFYLDGVKRMTIASYGDGTNMNYNFPGLLTLGTNYTIRCDLVDKNGNTTTISGTYKVTGQLVRDSSKDVHDSQGDCLAIKNGKYDYNVPVGWSTTSETEGPKTLDSNGQINWQYPTTGHPEKIEDGTGSLKWLWIGDMVRGYRRKLQSINGNNVTYWMCYYEARLSTTSSFTLVDP